MRNTPKIIVATFAIASLVGAGLLTAETRAEPGAQTSTQSVSRETDRVDVVGEHHYNSSAERAHDAMLISEVKSALSHDGVANDYPVAVDCDHGKIVLSGVVSSAWDVKHAGDIAAAAEGVTGVKNQLTWH
jgi:osmotically-inducible protein OsmY